MRFHQMSYPLCFFNIKDLHGAVQLSDAILMDRVVALVFVQRIIRFVILVVVIGCLAVKRRQFGCLQIRFFNIKLCMPPSSSAS